MATIKEIAARCGCSAATVSKALHGMSDISAETKKRIQAVAQEMGYVPNAAARTLRTNRSRVIGLLLFLRGTNVWEHEYFSQIAAGIQSVTEPAGYDVAPVSSDQKDIAGHYLDYCIHRGYDGVIIMSAGFDENGLSRMIESPLPIVTIDYALSGRSAVLADNEQGMRDLTEYVISQGHRRIAFIHGEDSRVTESRIAAFRSTCEAHGIDIPPAYVKPSVYRSLEDSAQATQELLSLPERPTCIIYPDDYAYIGGMNVLMDAGLRIPEDISVAGYDGIPLAGLLRPNLTTVSQNGKEIGSCTGRLMLQALDTENGDAHEHVRVHASLIKGQSVAPPKEG